MKSLSSLIGGLLSKLPSIECQKGGLHEGELQNIVCLDKKCVSKLNFLSCNQCIDELHKSHASLPVKLLLNDILLHAAIKKSSFINLKQMVIQQKQQDLDRIDAIKNRYLEQFEHVKQFISNSYSQFFSWFQNVGMEQYETVDTDLVMKHLEHCIESEDYLKLLYELISKIMISTPGEKLMNSATKNNLIIDIPLQTSEFVETLEEMASTFSS